MLITTTHINQMAKVDLGAISSVIYISGELTDITTDIGTLPSGEWVCTPIYPLNIDVTFAPNAENHVIATASNYRGIVVCGCYSLT